MPRRRDAPITATERAPGSCARRRRRRSARAPRSARGLVDSEVGSSISIASGVERMSTGNPLSRKTSIILWLCGQHLGGEDRDPVQLGDCRRGGRAGSSRSRALPRVGDEERDLGAIAAGADIRGMGDDRRRRAAERHERERGRRSRRRPTSAVTHLRSGAPKKRKPIDSRDSPSRNARIWASSSARTGRTCTVEPSRSTTSASRSCG